MASTAEIPARIRRSPTLALLRSIFGALVALLTFVGECAILLGDSVKRLFTRPHETGEVVNQMAFIGVMSVPIVVLTTFFSGAVLAQYSAEILIRYGASTLAGATVGMAVVREIGPVLAGIMVAARCGSAMAAQIGSMAVTEQIDALRALSVPPINYLVIPRLVASVVMLPVLALVGMYSGIVGGYLVAGCAGHPGRHVHPVDPAIRGTGRHREGDVQDGHLRCDRGRHRLPAGAEDDRRRGRCGTSHYEQRRDLDGADLHGRLPVGDHTLLNLLAENLDSG